MLFDKEQNIYVMTKNKVTKMKVQECLNFNTCDDCIGANDPFCGWCTVQNKCSLREECAGISQETIDWLSYKHDKCITITKIQPKYIQSTTARTLALTINNLPVSEDKLFCAFKFIEQTLITNATRTASGVTCATPNVWCLPPIPSGH
ncbi:plexin-B2-like, partial [Centruroides vittatus]|uniref:plexin-B2-like n=1 Tax=Centruroides vittatus TaxID=120091 RepID=UPI00350F2796